MRQKRDDTGGGQVYIMSSRSLSAKVGIPVYKFGLSRNPTLRVLYLRGTPFSGRKGVVEKYGGAEDWVLQRKWLVTNMAAAEWELAKVSRRFGSPLRITSETELFASHYPHDALLNEMTAKLLLAGLVVGHTK